MAAMHFPKRAIVLRGAVVCALAFTCPRLLKQDTYRGRPVSDWVHDALDFSNWAQTGEARDVVISELRGRAVPAIMRELQSECHSGTYYAVLSRVLILQSRLPFQVNILKEPNPAGQISAAAFVLGQMGEPAKPAIEALARTLKQSAMHAWESQDVMTELIGMGPVAQDALPHLRQIAADKDNWQRAPAAFALYTIEGNTNILVQVIREQLGNGRFDDFDRQIAWFRADEQLKGWVLPMLCKAVSEPDRSDRERESIAFYLGEVVTTNSLPATTLEALLENEPEGEFRTAVGKALNRLCDPEKLER